MTISNGYALHFPSLEGIVSGAEWDARLELAAAFRVADHLGWNEGVYSHISARVPDEPDAFLMNPQIGWHEITASSLIKLDMDGNLRSDAGAPYGLAGRNFHGGILKGKPELNCVFHIHPLAGVAISAVEEGLLFFDQSATRIYGSVAYHGFEGMVYDKDEAFGIIDELGDNFVMIMRNHGVLSVGRNIGEAVTYMSSLVTACQVQLAIQSMQTKARTIPADVCSKSRREMTAPLQGRPLGEQDWAMYRRLADKYYPDYAK